MDAEMLLAAASRETRRSAARVVVGARRDDPGALLPDHADAGGMPRFRRAFPHAAVEARIVFALRGYLQDIVDQSSGQDACDACTGVRQ